MELYHCLNRGVDKRALFLDKRDYMRFVQNLNDFNDTKDATHDRLKNGGFVNPREQLVSIHAWCLMKNHYHLLLSEHVEGGMTRFIRKLNVGYANYFNERYKRSGTLFQGRTKKKLIDSEAYFLHILHYIHLNPLDYLKGAQEWRTLKVHSVANAMKQVGEYPWSSYRDYCNKSVFPSIIDTRLFSESLGSIEKKTLTYMKNIEIAAVNIYGLD